MKKTWTTPSGEHFTLYRSMLEQPHLMIAGTTGSGKSVVINALMYTALRCFPFDTANGAQFILIDPRRVELTAYKDLPHTLYYASEPSEFLCALQYAMNIMESRYKVMRAAEEKKYSGGHVYVIIDEFSDLMATNKKQAQFLVQRLTQVGRAANVHIILATQCPIAKVIPTEIKINFDARVGLRTRSAQDSRNILGVSGCELLPRYGQGYYMNPEETTLYSLPMISDEDMATRIKWWTDQKTPPSLFSKLFGRRK